MTFRKTKFIYKSIRFILLIIIMMIFALTVNSTNTILDSWYAPIVFILIYYAIADRIIDKLLTKKLNDTKNRRNS